MYETSGGEVLWDRVALVLVIILAAILAIWWLESRFDSLVAVMTVGGLLAVGLVLFGFKLAAGHTRNTLNTAADFLHEVKQSERQQFGVFREYAKAESHALKRGTDLEFLQAKRVDQLAQQRAKLIADNQKSDARYVWEDEPSNTDAGFEVFE